MGDVYTIIETEHEIHIGADFPNEYTGSVYTYRLKGAAAKAKANAAQGIPEIIEIATGGHFRESPGESCVIASGLGQRLIGNTYLYRRKISYLHCFGRVCAQNSGDFLLLRIR